MAVRENVTITYRGARYEFGHGQNFYGIWMIGAPGPQPLEWWPQTPAGWAGAWSRFNGIEAPGMIVPAGQPVPQPAAAQAYAPPAAAAQGYGSQPFTAPSPAGPGPVGPGPGAPGPGAPGPAGPGPGAPGPAGPGFAAPGGPTPPRAGALAALRGLGTRQIAAAALLAAGVVVGFAGLFPVYTQGGSLASAVSEWVPHLIYFAAWVASAVLILLGGERARIGALLGLGTTIVTFGLFFADAGTALTTSARLTGAGLVLGLIGWTVCAVGSALAFRPGPDGRPARPRGFEIGSAAMVVLAALGTAIAFAPAWDRYTLQSGVGTRTFIEGDAFASPGVIIAGNVAVMAAVVLVAVMAAIWRPGRLGAALLAGATVPMAAQAVSAIVQAAQSSSAYNFFGITPGQAAAAGVTASLGLTAAFWLYGAFVLVMIALCARMLTMSGPAAGVTHSPFAARPLAFPGSGPHTFRADGPYAVTAAGPQTAGSGGSGRPAGPGGTPAGEPAATTAGEPARTTDGEPARATAGEPARATAGEPAGTTDGGQPATPPDGIPAPPAAGGSSG